MNAKALCALITPIIAVSGFVLWPNSAETSAPKPADSPSTVSFKTGAAAPSLEASISEPIEINSALEQRLVEARFSGNGREKMRASLTNLGKAPLSVQIAKGQVFSSGNNLVLVAQSKVVEVAPGKSAEMPIQTIAIGSTNKVKEAPFVLSALKAPQFDALLEYAQNHVELSLAAMQTVALVIAENLPLSAVAKFTSATEELQSRFDTDAFRVEPIDIIAALTALRNMGVDESLIALTIDPQLKIESMIEPLSRVAAMRYYGISEEEEWSFWKTELLGGAPATRHYALYGIARFYPEIALEMLPKWACEPKTNSVYRLSALQALADTQRDEALPILRQLSQELGVQTELGRAALGAAECLDQRLKVLAARQTAVAFRASKTLSKF